MNYTWRDLFKAAWPDVPSSEASAADVALFTAHANSLNLYFESKGE